VTDLSQSVPAAEQRLPDRRPDRAYYALSPTGGEKPDYFVKVHTNHPANSQGDPTANWPDEWRRKYSIPDKPQPSPAITHEYDMAPEVEAVASGSEAQDIARKYGLTGVSYVKPVAAVTETPAHRGALVYEWVDGQMPHYPDAELHRLAPQDRTVPPGAFRLPGRAIMDLHELFERHAICPIDLRHNNMLVEQRPDGPHLRLLDAESFTRMRSPIDWRERYRDD
jgi:hypothetical protein